MTNAELTISANYIRALASLPDATDRISLFLSGLLPSQSKSNEQPKPRDVSALLFFSPKEIDKMPKHFKTLFKTNKIHAHIRKKNRRRLRNPLSDKLSLYSGKQQKSCNGKRKIY